MGHAGHFYLADEKLLTAYYPDHPGPDDVSGLTNGAKLPVMAALTCLVGNFSEPGYESLGEQMVVSTTGGAIAVWSPSGLSDHPNARRLNETFFEAIFTTPNPALGDVVRSSLAAYATGDNAAQLPAIYILLGDPATILPIP